MALVLGIIAKPLFFLLLWVCFIYPIKKFINLKMPPGRVKDFLFKER